jgi:hypothetical protein
VSDEQREEFALDPAARAVEPMRVARAQQSPWDTPPVRDSCGTVKWTGWFSGLSGLPGLPRLPGPAALLPRAARERPGGEAGPLWGNGGAYPAARGGASSAQLPFGVSSLKRPRGV